MANFRALTIQSGTTKQQQDADSLVVGSGATTAVGDLNLSSFTGAIKVIAGQTLSTTGTGNIDLPNNASARFKIEGVTVSANVTAAKLGTLTAGAASDADALHTHAGLSPPIKQTKFFRLGVNVSTTSTTFVDFDAITIAITTIGSTNLFVQFMSSVSTTSGNKAITIAINIDGVDYDVAAAQIGSADSPVTAAAMTLQAVAAGAHTVKLRWKTSAGTAQCRASTTAAGESAALLVQEQV